MIANEALHTIIKTILDRQLGPAIAHLENYLFTFSQPQAQEQLTAIKADYELMVDYWQRGFDDPQRDQLYDKLLRRMYVLATNVSTRYYIRNSNYVSSTYNFARSIHRDWSPAALRRDMESFVSDVAMLQFEPEHTRQEKQKKTYEQHLEMMFHLFDYIWTTRLWTDGVTEAFRDMMLSPTIDVIDQQLLVSAVTLSLLNFFGYNKFRLLVDVYQQATDEHVRQRALVGWVLCLDSDAARLYPEMHELVKTVTRDERCREEMAELQMQIIYCLQAESDTQIIQSEIMPELMNSSNIRITRNGIEEAEDDPMQDVLHPEISEQRMERMEKVIERMTNMQRQGSDIYFGGFKQMKRFPFFATVANWFMPYFKEHPAVTAMPDSVRGSLFLLKMLEKSPLCDSDKYSFLLGYHLVVDRLPESLRAMMDRGEATIIGGEVAPEEVQSPAFYRLSYLQGLYRFFRVYPHRSEFVNPFDATQQPRYLFFANSLLRDTQAEEKFGEVTAFLLKRKDYDDARLTLQNYRKERRDAQFYMLNGTLLSRTHAERNAGLTAGDSYARLLELEPQNERAWAGYARAMFGCRNYLTALDYYTKLAERHPDNRSYLLNQAVCLTNLKQYEEALKLLYRLNYESPDDLDVSRVLAWTLVGSAKYQQAQKIYAALLQADPVAADDLLNYGYCLWFHRAMADAADVFRRYAAHEDVQFDAAKEFQAEAPFIREHGVSDVEIQLMTDLLS